MPAAYLKAGINELIYVKQVQVFEDGDPSQVWELKEALYGLKQAGRKWDKEIDSFLNEWAKLTRVCITYGLLMVYCSYVYM